MEISNLHISVCGHSKHGKSTLAGRLAYELKAPQADEKRISLLREQAKNRGRDWNAYQLVFMSQYSNHGMDPSRTRFPGRGSMLLDRTRLTLIDTPGHVDLFYGNIIYGIYLSDASLVVVDAKDGVAIGTEVVCRMMQAFGVQLAGFCVTKMDTVGFSQDRFLEVSDQVRELLVDRYFPTLNADDIPIIPVAARDDRFSLAGGADSDLRWYSGVNVLDVIRSTRASVARANDLPVRVTVEGPGQVFSPPGTGTVVVGCLESGTIRPGMELIAQPASAALGRSEMTRVRSVRIAKDLTSESTTNESSISARSIVAIMSPDWSRELARSIFKHGGTLSSKENPARVATRVLAELFFFDSESVYAGKQYQIQPNVTTRNGTVSKILGELHGSEPARDRRRGDIRAVTSVQAELEFNQATCLEIVSEFPRLSRFTVSERNRVVGCGKCISVIG